LSIRTLRRVDRDQLALDVKSQHGTKNGEGAGRCTASPLNDRPAPEPGPHVRLALARGKDLYLTEGPAAKLNKRASSWATDRSNIERHVKPLLGHEPTKALTQADVAKFQAIAASTARFVNFISCLLPWRRSPRGSPQAGIAGNF
jgi:hypothetical protein